MYLSDPGSKEKGVSPVIGVMLMLVVTIIVAAVVSAFATGLSDSSADTPVASFEFKIYSNYQTSSVAGIEDEGYVEATMKSGEPVDTSDLKIVSYHEDENGTLASKEFEKSDEVTGAYDYLEVFRCMHQANAKAFGVVGTYWHTGEKFTGGSEYTLGVSSPEAGDRIEINLVYKPTNTIIWSDEVTVI